jgi:hypothetical protein
MLLRVRLELNRDLRRARHGTGPLGEMPASKMTGS